MERGSGPPAAAMAEEDRRLAFEARKFALETLVKIYLEQSNGSRALVVSHTRVMLTLSLAAMAGFVTIVAAMLRTGTAETSGWLQPVPVVFALAGLALLVASALLATKALAVAAQTAANLLHDPFPTARKELEDMFGTKNEDIVLDRLVATVQLHIADTVPSNPFGTFATVSLVAGTALAAASLVLPFVGSGR